MEDKNIVATIYLKDGKAVAGFEDMTVTYENVIELAKLYNDSGIDKIIIFDLSSKVRVWSFKKIYILPSCETNLNPSLISFSFVSLSNVIIKLYFILSLLNH